MDFLGTVAIMDVGRPELDVVPRVDADWNAVNEVGFRLERQKVDWSFPAPFWSQEFGT